MQNNQDETFFKKIQDLISSGELNQAEDLLLSPPVEITDHIYLGIKLGEIFYLEFRYEDALEQISNLIYEIPLENHKTLAFAKFQLAKINFVLDFEVLAEQDIKDAIAFDPNNLMYFRFFIKMLSVQKRFSEIIALVSTNMEKFESSPICLNFLSEALIAEGDYSHAEIVLEHILKMSPNLKIALINLAYISIERMEFEKAELLLKAATVSEVYMDEYEIFLAWERLKECYEEQNKEHEVIQCQAEFDKVLEEYRKKHPLADI